MGGLLKYQFLILFFLICLVEGPVVTYIGGFLSFLNYFDFMMILFLSFLGSFIADVVIFYIGRGGRKSFIGDSLSRLVRRCDSGKVSDKVRRLFRTHPFKLLFLIKFVPGFSVPGVLYMGGHMDSKFKFMIYSLFFSLAHATLFAVLGFFTGSSLNTFLVYFNYGKYILPASVIVLGIVIYLFVKYKPFRRINLLRCGSKRISGTEESE